MVDSESRPELLPPGGRRSGRVFVGRQREMAELTAALDHALFGHGQLVMLVGEPGIGKTRTAQELASQAAARGAQVLWGWCYEEEGAPPYWPWVQPIRLYVPGIPQIKPTFLDIAPCGIPSNIIPHSKGIKCGLIRSNSPFSYSNHRPAKPKIPKPLVYAQVSPLGTSFATP